MHRIILCCNPLWIDHDSPKSKLVFAETVQRSAQSIALSYILFTILRFFMFSAAAICSQEHSQNFYDSNFLCKLKLPCQSHHEHGAPNLLSADHCGLLFCTLSVMRTGKSAYKKWTKELLKAFFCHFAFQPLLSTEKFECNFENVLNRNFSYAAVTSKISKNFLKILL